jgi:Flp pilus assembly secretin CpaC
VSRLDYSIQNSVDKLPGLQANRMKTQVDARYGVPLLLSGLLQQTDREQAKGLPFLSQIPVLGPLFGSQDYLRPVPPPRNWISPAEERELRASADFPWNVLR